MRQIQSSLEMVDFKHVSRGNQSLIEELFSQQQLFNNMSLPRNCEFLMRP